MNDLYAVCAPGLEEATEAELRELGAADVRAAGAGGVQYRADDRQEARIRLGLRTVVRVLRRVAEFPARDRRQLSDGLSAVDWAGLPTGGGVRATARKSKLHHTGLIEEAVRKAAGLPAEAEGTSIRVRLERDVCTVSVVMGPERLDHRGWRTDVGPAPLRESVAAAVLRLSGWDRQAPLLDPLCGSGVLPLEAADWARQAGGSPQIVGADVRPEAVDAARGHAAAAGLQDAIEWQVIEVSELAVQGGPGWVVCNPPWGKRLEVGQVYAELGRLLRRLKGWRAAVITPKGGAADDLEGTLGRGPERVIPFRHGGVAVALRLYERLGTRARSRRRPAGRSRRRAGRS